MSAASPPCQVRWEHQCSQIREQMAFWRMVIDSSRNLDRLLAQLGSARSSHAAAGTASARGGRADAAVESVRVEGGGVAAVQRDVRRDVVGASETSDLRWKVLTYAEKVQILKECALKRHVLELEKDNASLKQVRCNAQHRAPARSPHMQPRVLTRRISNLVLSQPSASTCWAGVWGS